ncbi:MAG: hypothetical protein P4M01_06865 [Acidobacteriota bacterium]|nr:hypothetical protein [Acidobacteriota bacterium]
MRGLILLACAVLSTAPSGYSQIALPAAQYITTIAGQTTNTTPVFYGDNGPATSAILYEPQGIAIDKSSNVYVADAGFNRIRKVSYNTGYITTVAGTTTGGYTGDGGPATSADITLGAFQNLTVDSVGNLYFVDATCRVRKITASTGSISTVAGTGSCGYSGDGGAATSAKISAARGITVDTLGNIYIADYGNYRVRKITVSSGVISTVAGNGTQICCGRASNYGDGGLATSAEFSGPQSVAIDSNNNIYIVDQAENRIRMVNASTGIISTVIGTGTAGYTGDGGAAGSAKINNPIDITIDPANNIYFFDWGNNRIRKVASATGIISTIAGTSTAGDTGDGGLAANAEISARGLTVDAIGNLYFTVQIQSGSTFTNSVRVISGNAYNTFINPKYIVMGVTYAPPGPSSYVQYQLSTQVGTTTTYTNSFSSELAISAAFGAGIAGWDEVNGTGKGSITGTASSDWTQGSGNSSSITLSKTTTKAYKTGGTGDAFNPVNHGDDIIWSG